MATREEAVQIAKGWQVWSEWWDRADSIGPEAGPQPEVPLDGDSVRIADDLASALLALDERVRVLEQENSELRAAVIAVADSHESRRSIVREIAAYRSVANNLSKPFSIADVARRCEALATGEGKEG